MSHIAAAAAATIVFAVFAPITVAQEATAKWTCQDVGQMNPAEPIGDRDNHSISVNPYSCRIDGGPFSGGVATGIVIWEDDGPKSIMLVHNGVIRKPGSMAGLYSWTASGTGKNVLATGAWAPL